MTPRLGSSDTPIAIVGMACLLPGAHTPEEFWAGLRAGTDHRTEGGREVFGTDPATPGGWGDEQHRITATRGGFVTEPEIDLTGLRVAESELAGLGRVARWPVYAIRRALADAGIAEHDPVLASTGLLLGNYSFPTERSVELCVPLVRRAVTEGLRAAGVPVPPADNAPAEISPANLWPSGLPATVVADAFGLGGPRIALDAACSSALYTLALGRDYLATGRADVVLAGAVCAPDPLLIHLSFSDLHAYPVNGISQPFDARSSGIVTGQGAGVLVLKRLADAERDGDRIHAVLDSIGLANDGAGVHMLSPNVRGQLDAYRQAYRTLDPSTVDYIECHATGTPLGDSTELRGVTEFFGEAAPLLGSVKGNVGHLLTVAGFTSVLKAVLAIRHGIIPATPGVDSPRDEAVAGRIVREECAWPDRDGRPRRAGVSAFGFGGTDAHAVLTAHTGQTSRETEQPKPPKLAVTGLGVRLGPITDPAGLERAVRAAQPALTPRPDQRWYGADELSPPVADGAAAEGGYVSTVDFDVRTYRIPPAELGDTNPQHLVLFNAADQALADAGFPEADVTTRVSELPTRRIGVVIAMEMEPRTHSHRARFDIGAHVRAECTRAGLALAGEELDRLEAAVRAAVHEPIGANEVLSYIGNVMASRISSSRNLTGPAFTISADATAGARALEVAGLLLLDPTIDAVLVGGVELAAGVENTIARTRLADRRGEPAPVLGDGAVAMVLRRTEDLPAGQRSYGTVDAVEIRHGADALADAVRHGLRSAGVDQSDVELVELATPAAPADLAALAGVFTGDEDTVRTTLGSVVPLIGDTQHASVLAGLAKVLLCLHRAELPPAPAALRTMAAEVPELDDSALHLASEVQPWLSRGAGSRRSAVVAAATPGGAAQIVLSAAEPSSSDGSLASSHGIECSLASSLTEVADWTGGPGVLMLPLHADDGGGLAEAARACLAELAAGRDALALVRERVHAPRAGRYTAVLVAADAAALRRELDAAARDLPEVIATEGDWATPAGSFCTARPLGPRARVAFVYPGAFTTYPGAGRDLFRLFPGLRADFERGSDRPDARFKHRALYPRATHGVDRRALMQHEARMVEDIPVMLATGTNFAVLHTRLLRDVLGVRLDGGFGYSLGESSMLFATGVWADSARDDAALAATPLFRDRLRGPKRLVRDTWGLPESTSDNAVWTTKVLLADLAEVRTALTGFDRLFLTHVNRPGEVVVAGDPAQCAELIDRLGCASAKAPANHVMHNPMVDPVLDDLAALNTYPLGTPDTGLELLSAYDYGPVDVSDSGRIAERIAHTLRSTIDFARLVGTAYERGFRYFIEVGPGATCTRWIGETLSGRAHLAVSVDRRGAATGTALAQALARLVSHGLPVRLDTLFPTWDGRAPRPAHTVTCGGESVPHRVRVAAADTMADILLSTVKIPAQPREVPVVMSEPEFGPDPTETIVIEGEPYVYLPASAPAPVPVAAAPVPAPRPMPGPTPPTAPVDGRLTPLQALANKVSEAHRSVLRAHDAIQEHALRALESAHNDVSGNRNDVMDNYNDVVGGQNVVMGGRGVVWDYPELLEFARGRVSNVFGPEFAVVDSYPLRVRLPEPPYLFVSRVTDLKATTGKFEPSSITTEYDIPRDAWYTVDGLAPCAVTIEAGQCDLLLVSYLGIDFRNQGKQAYRLLDSRLVFHGDLPREGQTLRYDINIDRFVWNDDSLLFFFNYKCYADGELILELLDACAGFFDAAQLDDSLGVVFTEADRKRRAAMTHTWFTPLARTDRTELSTSDLELLSAGRLAEVFGAEWDQRADGCNPSIRLPGQMLRMVDEITSIDRLGGPRGLGELSAVKHLDPDGWYFRCHFTGDPVLAGSLVAEGGVQLLQTYAMSLGLHLVLPDAEFQSVPGLHTEVKVRGQITPNTPNIRYHVEITEITMLPRPTVIADIVVYDGDKPIITMRDFGIQVREKPGTAYRPGKGGIPPFLGRRNHTGEAAFINELHLAHAAKGDLATAMGTEFEIYANRRAPYIPNGDFRFVDRIMLLDGTRGELKPGSRMATEYDCPPEAWYLHENSFANLPNCVYMESSLQAAILLGYYLGATTNSPDEELSIRNLDGKATVVKDIDLRGKTIRHNSTMLMSQSVPGTVLQSFRYELSADDEVFYVGESLFGYFSAEGLANQIGLDAGKRVPPWLEASSDLDPERVRTLEVSGDDRWFAVEPGRLRLADGHLRLVDEVCLVADGGTHELGYVHGRRRITHDDWYFSCHFHRDPVMPGSLGVEAVLQALQLFAMETGVAQGFSSPVFTMPLDVEMAWRYRGQILRTDEEMTIDAHVKEVRRLGDRVQVIADASVWKHTTAGEPGLRIYELTDIAVEIREEDQEVSR